jgi:hypothetical protein
VHPPLTHACIAPVGTELVHCEHVTPPVPQAPAVSAAPCRHVPLTPPLQQPFAQEEPLQMQVPAVESLDVSQIRFVPHGAHAAPAVPHVLPCWAQGKHVPVGPPAQHPSLHELASHTHWPLLLSHSRPVGQAAQVAPLAPHTAPSLVSGVHAPPDVQQPPHVPPPQVQAPMEHACPPPQG